MKTSIVFCFCILLCCSGVTAEITQEAPQEGSSLSYYWGGSIGYAHLPDAYWKDPYAEGTVSCSEGYVLSGVYGAVFNTIPLRAEFELLFQHNEISSITSDSPLLPLGESASIALLGGMANAYLDLRNKTPVTPYIMGGLGYGFYTIELDDDNVGDTSVFIYQAGAGIQYELRTRNNFHYTLDAGYRFVASSDPEIDEALGGTYETEYTAHLFMIGVRFEDVRDNSK